MSRRPSPPQPAPVAPPPSGASSWPDVWICGLIFALVILTYLPALSGGFIWDDDGHVTRTDLRSLSGLFRIWFEIGATQQYYPLLHSAFWVQHLAWGDSPLGYHIVNVLLHATVACLFGRLLTRLAVPGAWFAALLFALHPVCVESVAWISEQKNTLSAVFYLFAALAYLRFDRERQGKPYAVATSLFVLALLTKTVTASLPAALLVVFWWQRGRLDWRRDAVPLLPWFALGTGSGLFTAHFEHELIGAEGADFALSVVQRCLLAGRIVWFYLGKLAWPLNLTFIYPHWDIDASSAWQWCFLVAALAALGILVWWQRRSRAPLAAALLFAGTLFPVLGFINVYPFVYSYVADHFQYLASFAIHALAAAGFVRLAAGLPRWGRLTGAAALLAVLAALSWMQAGMYRDVATLYRTTIARNPACWMAYNNLAITLIDAGRQEEALPLLNRALSLKANYAQAENNLGDDLRRLGRIAEALPHLERAVRLEPRYFQAYNNLGIALMSAGRLPESLAAFEQSVKLQPLYAEAESNVGLALAKLGRTPEAIPHFARAVALKPAYADAQLGWAIATMLTSGLSAAQPHFEKAIALDPDNPEYPGTYGRALLQAGRLDEAAAQFDRVVRLQPDNADAQMNLALVLRQLGRLTEAAQHYQTAIQLNPALLNQRP